MGPNGCEWMQRDFAWHGIGDHMKTAYKWLLNGGNRPEWVRVD